MTELPVTDIIVAFVSVLAASFLIYFLGTLLSPKPVQDESVQSTYACGENATLMKFRASVSLYRYLIYFIVLDSSVLIIGFAALTLHTVNPLIFLLYLLIVVVSGFLLLGGGDR